MANTVITLKMCENTVYESKKGIVYYIRNDCGNYLVWVKKGKYINGSTRYVLVDEYRKPTKEIMERIKLERR